MATLTINDLPRSDVIDYKALSFVRGGGGAPWVFGAFRVFDPNGGERSMPTVNFYQTNNTFFIADQLNIQLQTINVDTAADTAVVNVNAGQDSSAIKLGG